MKRGRPIDAKSILKRVDWLCRNPNYLNAGEEVIFWRLQQAGFYSHNTRFEDGRISTRFCIELARKRMEIT